MNPNFLPLDSYPLTDANASEETLLLDIPTEVPIKRRRTTFQKSTVNTPMMSSPACDQQQLTVIESKTVCYCSNFDLNVNDWFLEYENIEIFKRNI